MKARVRNLVRGLLNVVQAYTAPVAYAVAGAVIDEHGRILLARHSYKVGWQLPLGGVERGEPASAAVMRELQEEIGLSGGEATLFAIYTRRGGWATNVFALYRVTGATVRFEPNLEVREIMFVDPTAPPAGCTEDSRRRLEELSGKVHPRPYW